MKTITIEGRFPSLNEYVSACRRNAYAGAEMVKKSEKDLIRQLKRQRIWPFKAPVRISYTYYEINRRRDLDNISGYFHKIFQDSLVKAGLLPDDGWQEITGYSDSFKVDKNRPRIEIEITEEQKNGK